jgi:hypothetical protein
MRKLKTFSACRLLALAVIVAAQCGCGSSNTAAPGSASSLLHPAKKARPPVAKKDETADMVVAVSTTRNGPPILLKFMLTQRPEVGQALDLQVAIIPQPPAPDALSASFQAVDGLDIVDGAQLVQVSRPAEGEPVRHVVKILPKRDGIFTLSGTVNVVSGDKTSSRTFSIPVISGQGMREQVAKSP